MRKTNHSTTWKNNAFLPMNFIRKYIRWIASSLLLNTFLYVFAPMSAWALTSGPTAPEYTSFEPLDTSDMVNLATGDLVHHLLTRRK